MKKIFSLSFALLALSVSIVCAQEKIPDYIRFEDDKLLTAVSRFEKDGNAVDLIAIIHVGDKTYFQKIDKSLSQYDAVLYEMVGGPYTEEKANAAKAEGELGQVQGMQKMITDLLGLEFQLDNINYAPKNFVHADMTSEQFMEHSDGGQIISSLMSKAIELSQSGKLKGLPGSEGDSNQMMMGLLGAVMSGDSNALKRTVGPILAEAEGLIAQLEGDEESVLIAKRNIIAIDALKGLEPKAGRKDAILYGAGHMPDLEKRLVEMGYKKTVTTWQAGWTIDENNNTEQKAPDLQGLMDQVGGLMKMLEENAK